MKRKMIKPIVMLVVFFTALTIFAFTLNKDKQDLTTSMPEATLPVLSFTYENTPVNELHGYVNEMDATAMRDSITPVSGERQLPVTVKTYGRRIDGVHCEIRSMDSQRLVAKNDVENLRTEGESAFGTIEIQNVLEEDQEYVVILTVTSGEENFYYYTRLMQTDGTAAGCLEFAQKFHEYTFREDADEFIPTYMDAATGDATTLDYVDLSCTLRQITWADFPGKKLTQPMISFKELNDSYNVLTFHYVMTNQNAAGETEFYNVEEYYRLRLTSTRMYVLNFERRMNQIFRGTNTFLSDAGSIQLGIRSADIEYAASETGDIIAFVQEGELWCYDRLGGKIAQVFSFRGAEGIDARENWNQHDIKIVRVDEAGSVDFVVYGYMNRGNHEGETGIGVYHYDGLVHTVNEEVFIPSEKSYEIIKAEMGQLMYVNDLGILYLMIDRRLYSINLDTLETKVEVDNLKESCCKTSASSRYFAWTDSEREFAGDVIHLMDFSDGTVYEITEESKVYLRPLGFIDEDFIYGAAPKEKVEVDAAGNTVFPMKFLKILATSQESREVLKTYRPQKGKIESISVEGYTITVNLFKKSGGQYLACGTDAIMNRVADTEGRVAVGQLVTEDKQTQRRIVLQNAAQSDKTVMVTSKVIVQETPRILSFEEREAQERFYVYVKGNVLLATDDIADAIIFANESLGVVVDNNQQYIWRRARKTVQNAFTGVKVNDADQGSSQVVQALSAMLEYAGEGLSVKELIDNGETPKSALETTLRERVVLDVSGCTVNEIIYYVSEGSPVFAMTGSESAVLVTGYSANMIYYYDPAAGATKSISYESAGEWFSGAGNVFFTYLNEK
ncbi:MAG: hypothetical protein NC180_07765 [Muribaculaceae bacterium]|nr:hypothetical protein [Roseburia sp.]MCM1430173.1 hypothetical protein [Muribaculaceae bacterium]MCM1493103.1 hypothetical protein [Muribaculaceae bacterium]